MAVRLILRLGKLESLWNSGARMEGNVILYKRQFDIYKMYCRIT